MDKKRFIDIAPAYYGLAIMVHFRSQGGVAYRHEIEREFTNQIENNEYEELLSKEVIFERAIE
jgi:hypothetical protein